MHVQLHPKASEKFKTKIYYLYVITHNMFFIDVNYILYDLKLLVEICLLVIVI